MRKWIAATALITAMTATGLAQDVEKGSNVFKQCQPCHAIGPGAQNKIGPELNGLDGQKLVRLQISTIQRRTRIRALSGTNRRSRNT